jgi:8-oxo-dGTP diphosphatase
VVSDRIRVTVRAVISRDGALLLSEYDDETGLHYNLPGGGVELGEGLHEALCREVMEETGWRVEVGALLYVWEYVPHQHDFVYGDQQTVALCFACKLLEDTEQPTYDPHQTGIRWVALGDLPDTRLLPPQIIPYLMRLEAVEGNVFIRAGS